MTITAQIDALESVQAMIAASQTPATAAPTETPLPTYKRLDGAWVVTELNLINSPIVQLSPTPIVQMSPMPTATVQPTSAWALPVARMPILGLMISTAPPAAPPTPIYACNGVNDLDCDDFPTGIGAATAHLRRCGNEDQMDGGGDGRACERSD